MNHEREKFVIYSNIYLHVQPGMKCELKRTILVLVMTKDVFYFCVYRQNRVLVKITVVL